MWFVLSSRPFPYTCSVGETTMFSWLSSPVAGKILVCYAALDVFSFFLGTAETIHSSFGISPESARKYPRRRSLEGRLAYRHLQRNRSNTCRTCFSLGR